MSNIFNRIGLEAEFFVTNNKGELLFPASSGFQTDSFVILGEFRAEPGTTRIETVTNFMESWLGIQERAKSKCKVIDINPYQEVDIDLWSTILKKQGTKEITQSQNIYGTDITRDSDAIISRSKIKGHRLSIGFHIHFSSYVEAKTLYTTEESHYYEPVTLPLQLSDTGLPTMNIRLWDMKYKKEPEVKEVKASVSRITKPVIHHIVEDLDNTLFPAYKPDVQLKFRKPGFYELKGHGGFEYRSLPFSQAVLDNLYPIVDHCYNLLEDLDV